MCIDFMSKHNSKKTMLKNKESNVISVDIGTSSVRACLVDPTLNIIYHTQSPINLSIDIGGKAEQDSDEIINAAFKCITNVTKWAEKANYRPEALCFSNTVSSLVCLDSNFMPARPIMTYADVRACDEAIKLKIKFGKELFHQTACPVHASYWLPKLIWLKNQNFPLSTSNYFCTIKDVLIYKLTGHFVTDYSNAVATGMCNVTSGDWDLSLLKLAGIKPEQLPVILPTTTIIQTKKTLYPADLNLPENLKIVLGATDGVLSSLGAGAIKSGQVTTMIGSSGACRIAAESPLINDSEIRTWSYPLADGIWIRGGAMNSGGLVAQWLVNNFFQAQSQSEEQAFYEALEQASLIDAGSDGLTFLPYLFGERAPIWDENARGVYFGIHGNHHRGHFARATIEGILFALYSIFEILKSNQEEEIEIRATGGYLRSHLMLQIQANIFGIPVGIPRNYEGSSVGAAALAFRAMHMFSSLDEVSELIQIEKTYKPDKLQSNYYKSAYINFKELYQQLKPLFRKTNPVKKHET